MPDRSVSPSEFSLLGSPITPPPAVYPWDEPSQIQDDAARAALIGLSLETLKARYASRLDLTVEAIERRNSLHSAAIEEKRDLLTQQIADNQSSYNTLAAARDETRRALPDLQRIENEMDSRVRGFLFTLLARRDQFKARHEDQLRIRIHQQRLEEAESQKKVAESRACAARQDRETNSESVKRVESDAAADVARAAESVQQTRDACRKLLELGLTPTVARFLTWMPVLSFGIARVLLAPLSPSPRPDFAAEAGKYYQLQDLLGNTHSDRLALFGQYACLLAAVALVMVFAILVAFWLLGRLDPMRVTPARRTFARADEAWEAPSAGHLDLLISAERSRVKGRLALMRCVPLLPLALAIGVAFFLQAVTALSGQITPRGSASMQLAPVGPLFAASLACSGAMFWFFLLRPLQNNEPVASRARLFYVLLLVAPFVGLATAGTLPALEKSMAVALVGISALVISMTFGHGVYLRGIFARAHEALSEEDRLRRTLSLAARLPVPEDYMPVIPLLPVAPADRPPEASPQRFRWRLWRRPPVAEVRLSEDEQVKALIEEAHVPSDLVDAINGALLEREVARSNRSSAEVERARLDQDLLRLSTAVAADREELGRLQRIQVEVLDAHGFLILRLRTEFERIMQALEDAYQLARASAAGARASTPL